MHERIREDGAVTYAVATSRLAEILAERKFHAYMGGSNDCRFHDLDAYAIALSTIYGCEAEGAEDVLELNAEAAFKAKLKRQAERHAAHTNSEK